MHFGPYLKEAIDCKTKFGDELFGDFYKKGEKDTPEEKELFNHIKQWIKGDSSGEFSMSNSDQKKILKAFKGLKECSKHWPDILSPNKTKLHRGVLLPIAEAEKLGISDIGDKKNGTYKPINIMESWTADLETADLFISNRGFHLDYNRSAVNKLMSAKGMKGKPHFLPVVISANFSEAELLFSSVFLNSVSNFVWGQEEHEIVRISNKPTKVLYTVVEEMIGYDKH